MTPVIDPQIGQFVHYTLSPADVAEVLATGLHMGGQARALDGQTVAALVTDRPDVNVLDDDNHPTGDVRKSINLRLLLDGTADLWRRDVAQGSGPGTWHYCPPTTSQANPDPAPAAVPDPAPAAGDTAGAAAPVA